MPPRPPRAAILRPAHHAPRPWPRPACIAATLAAGLLIAAAAARSAAPDDSITAQEEALWQKIQQLGRDPASEQPFGLWLAQAAPRRVELLEQLRLYLTAYPGGTHRDAAIKLELATMFEAATLADGDLDPLRRRVDDLLRDPPSPAAEHEAAYWQIIVLRDVGEQDNRPPATQPLVGADDSAEREMLAAYRLYIERYPASRHVPRLATVLFEHALRQGNRDGMQAVIRHMGEHFPAHAATKALMAEWNRVESVGKPFWLAFTSTHGHPVDTREYRGHPLLIVVWARFDAEAVAAAEQVEAYLQAHPRVRAVGVSLDVTPEATNAACQRLGIHWPQFNDEFGWGNVFVRSWGVRRIPHVFVIDAQGRLVGSTTEGQWQAWLDRLPAAVGGAPATRPAGGGAD